MLPVQRRGLILDAVRSGHGVEVVQLAPRFAVSEMTVRRGLARLAGEGRTLRVVTPNLAVVVTDATADHPGVVALEREGVEVVRG